MNTIGIDDNLNRARIKKLLIIGLMGSAITGIGDFLLGFAEETASTSMASSVMSGASNLADWQIVAGSLLGVFGLFLEGLALFAIYRLMADAAPKYAHIFRAGIFGYIWLAPIGCHMNMGVLNLAYKYLLMGDVTIAEQAAQVLFYGFSLPLYILLAAFWIPLMVVQFKAFAESKTPYPTYAKWFNVVIGAIPAMVVSAIIGPRSALGAAIGTMFLSCGNAFVFGGLLATLPSQESFDRFLVKLA